MLAVEYGFGYHLLPATTLFGLAIFAVSKLFPPANSSLPYQSIVSPFKSFTDLKLAHQSAKPFKKHRYSKPTAKQNSVMGHYFWLLVAACFMAVASPVILLILAIPDTEPKYEAIAG